MKKRLIVFLITTFIVLTSALCGCTAKYTDGLVFRLCSTDPEDGVSVVYYSVSGGDKTDYTQVVIPAVYKKTGVKEIEFGAFRDCRQLTGISISENINIIGTMAFANCSALLNIALPSKLSSIGTSAFLNSGLTSVDIPDSVIRLELQAFAACTSLQSVSLPSSLKLIEQRTFAGCNSLRTVTMPAALEEIEYRAFENCSALTTITLPNTLKTIGAYAFYGAGLTSVSLPANVTWISDSAFADCTGLKTVSIGKNIQEIEADAFKGCSALKTITLMPQDVVSFAAFDFECITDLKDFSVKVPHDMLEEYKTAGGWESYAEFISSI